MRSAARRGEVRPAVERRRERLPGQLKGHSQHAAGLTAVYFLAGLWVAGDMGDARVGEQLGVEPCRLLTLAVEPSSALACKGTPLDVWKRCQLLPIVFVAHAYLATAALPPPVQTQVARCLREYAKCNALNINSIISRTADWDTRQSQMGQSLSLVTTALSLCRSCSSAAASGGNERKLVPVVSEARFKHLRLVRWSLQSWLLAKRAFMNEPPELPRRHALGARSCLENALFY